MRREGRLVLMLAAGLVLAAGCGSSPQSAPVTELADAAPAPDDMSGFANVPDGWSDPPDVDLPPAPDGNIRVHPDARPRVIPPGSDVALPPPPDAGLLPDPDAAVAPPLPEACAALAYCCPRINSIPELAQSCTAQAAAMNEDECSAVLAGPWEAARACYQEFLMRRDR
jgi:hypothetical protein